MQTFCTMVQSPYGRLQAWSRGTLASSLLWKCSKGL